MIGSPGMIWNHQAYQPRFPFGTDGDIKVVSFIAGENIPLGVLLQVTAAEVLQIARDGTRLAGVAVYDPRRFDATLVYNAGDVVPVLRRGRVYCAYIGKRDPQTQERTRVYLGAGKGQFTTDVVGTDVGRMCFTMGTDPYYPNNDGSPAADLPFDAVPIPPGSLTTTFGLGVALLEMNLG